MYNYHRNKALQRGDKPIRATDTYRDGMVTLFRAIEKELRLPPGILLSESAAKRCTAAARAAARHSRHARSPEGRAQSYTSKREHRRKVAGEVMPTAAAGGHKSGIERRTPQADSGWTTTAPAKKKKQSGDPCPVCNERRKPTRKCTCVCHQCSLAPALKAQATGHRRTECSVCRSNPRHKLNSTHATAAVGKKKATGATDASAAAAGVTADAGSAGAETGSLWHSLAQPLHLGRLPPDEDRPERAAALEALLL